MKELVSAGASAKALAHSGRTSNASPARTKSRIFAGFAGESSCRRADTMPGSVASVLAALMLAGMQPCTLEMSFCAAPASSVRASGESVFRSKPSTRYYTFTYMHVAVSFYLLSVCLSISDLKIQCPSIFTRKSGFILPQHLFQGHKPVNDESHLTD